MHEVLYNAFPVSCGKDAITKHANEFVETQSDYHGGLYNRIRWYDNVTPLSSWDEAASFIRKNDRRSYDNLAVRFFEDGDKKKEMWLVKIEYHV